MEVDIDLVGGKESKSGNTPIEDSENEDCSATMIVLRDIEHGSYYLIRRRNMITLEVRVIGPPNTLT